MKSTDELRQMTEDALQGQLDSLGEIPARLREAMLYSLQAGGKRLRPVMLLASCEAAGGNVECALPYACALEMIHTYSLIHDDLPAMDNDDLRRGRPTSHKVFGEAMAILAGDGLLHAAMALMLKTACAGGGASGMLAAEAIARRSGVTGMVAGQTVDVTEAGQVPTEARIRYIHLHKTADLLTAAVEAGLRLAGADDPLLAAGISYGQHLGLAFQMVDDWLDVSAETSSLGKTAGKDEHEGKLTWVALRGAEQTRKDAAEETRLAIEALAPFGERAALLRRLAEEAQQRLS